MESYSSHDLEERVHELGTTWYIDITITMKQLNHCPHGDPIIGNGELLRTRYHIVTIVPITIVASVTIVCWHNRHLNFDGNMPLMETFSYICGPDSCPKRIALIWHSH